MRDSNTSLVVLAVVLAACSGGNDELDAPASEEGLMSTARAYANAFEDAPINAYDYWSAACQQSSSRSEWADRLATSQTLFESVYGYSLDELTFTDIELASFDGETGSVRVIVTGPDGEALDPEGEIDEWRYEDGRWVTDAACAEGSDSDNTE